MLKSLLKFITATLMAVSFSAALALTLPSLSASADCVETADVKCCGGVETTFLSCPSTGGQSGDIENSAVWQVLIIAFNIVTGVVGIAAVGGLVWGAIMYATAQDNASQVQQAIGVIRNVVIGVVMYVAMFSILQYLIPGGIFNP